MGPHSHGLHLYFIQALLMFCFYVCTLLWASLLYIALSQGSHLSLSILEAHPLPVLQVHANILPRSY